MSKRAKKPKFHPLAFGGWPDYQQWADNDFRPCPQQQSRPEPEPEPEPEPTPPPTPEPPVRRPHLFEAFAKTKSPVDRPPPGLPVEPEPPSEWNAFTKTNLEPVWGAFTEEPVEPPAPVPRPPAAEDSWEAFTAVNLEPVVDRPRPEPSRPPGGATDSDAVWADDDLVVRPYIRTHGRVNQGHDLRLETMLSVTRLHEREPGNPGITADTALICNLCVNAPQSVAEVSAYLNAPLGVARVLIADAIEAGLIVVDQHPSTVDTRPSRELLERVREGLLRMA